MAYRLHFMWDIPTYHCTQDTVNTVSVGFHPHKLAAHSNTWLDRLQDSFYKLHLKKARKPTFAHHAKLLASVEIGQGCTPRAKLQFASSDREHKSEEV